MIEIRNRIKYRYDILTNSVELISYLIEQRLNQF